MEKFELYDPDWDDDKAEEESQRWGDKVIIGFAVAGTILGLLLFAGYIPLHP